MLDLSWKCCNWWFIYSSSKTCYEQRIRNTFFTKYHLKRINNAKGRESQSFCNYPDQKIEKQILTTGTPKLFEILFFPKICWCLYNFSHRIFWKKVRLSFFVISGLSEILYVRGKKKRDFFSTLKKCMEISILKVSTSKFFWKEEN